MSILFVELLCLSFLLTDMVHHAPGAGHDANRRHHGALWVLRNAIRSHVRESSVSLARHQVC